MGSPVILILSELIQFLVLAPISLRSILILSSYIHLGPLRSSLPIYVNILKVMIPFSILTICPVLLKVLVTRLLKINKKLESTSTERFRQFVSFFIFYFLNYKKKCHLGFGECFLASPSVLKIMLNSFY